MPKLIFACAFAEIFEREGDEELNNKVYTLFYKGSMVREDFGSDQFFIKG